MKHLGWCLGLMAGLLGPASVWAQTDVGRGQEPLSLAEVLTAAERHAPALEVARAEVEGAEAELLAAQGGFDPQVRARAFSFPIGGYPYTRLESVIEQPTSLWGSSLFAGWRYGGGEIPSYSQQYATNAGGELRAGVSVPLWRNGPMDRRRAQLARAELGTEVAGHAETQSLWELRRAAALRYWDWVAAGRRHAIALALLRLARERDSQLEQRVRSGELAAFEQVDNQRALAQREGQVVAAERLLQQTAMELSLFLRDANGQPLRPGIERLPSAFPEPEAPSQSVGAVDLEKMLSQRPEVLRLEAVRAQQQVERRLAENQRAPSVDLSVAAVKDLGAGDAKRGKPELELGLSVELPTFNRAARGRARQAEAVLARAEAQLRLQRDRVAAEVGDALSALEAAHRRVEVARQELRFARELEQAERTRFQLGESTLLFVNLREQTSAEAAVREVDALQEYHKAAASLRAAALLPLAVR